MTTTGFHHLAVSTKDMRTQLDFFTEVVGMPLVALFDMHGVEGAVHAFLQLDDSGRCLSFTQVPGNETAPSEIGVTHAGTGAGHSAPGTMQHLAFEVADRDALLALQDRLRSHEIVVMGPIDHGMCESIYFAGPEGLVLEAAWSQGPIDPLRWVDPTVCERIGISPDEIERYTRPPEFLAGTERVPQPAINPDKPHLAYPQADYEKMVAIPDEIITRSASITDPPVPA